MDALIAWFPQVARPEYPLLFAIVFVSFAVKRLTGFGNTLIVNSAFSFIKENRFTTPVELLWNLPANAAMVWRDRASLDLRLAAPLCLYVGAGDLAGAWLLTVGNDAVLRSLLGLALVGMGVEMLLRRRAGAPTKAAAAGLSLTAGLMLGLFGIGALLAAHFNRLSGEGDRERYRANLCFVFLFDNILRVGAYGAAGLLNPETLGFSLALAPAVVLGMAAGLPLDRRLDGAALRRLIVVLLMVSGAAVCVRYRFGF